MEDSIYTSDWFVVNFGGKEGSNTLEVTLYILYIYIEEKICDLCQCLFIYYLPQIKLPMVYLISLHGLKKCQQGNCKVLATISLATLFIKSVGKHLLSYPLLFINIHKGTK